MGETYSVAPGEIAIVEPWKTLFEGITIPVRDVKYNNAYSQGGIVKRYGGENVDILLLGNSHALMWAPVIDEICQECHYTVLFYAVDAVYPFPSIPPKRNAPGAFSPEEWVIFESNRVSLIEQRHPRLVIVAGCWAHYTLDYRVSEFLAAVSNINRRGNSGRRSEVLFIEDPPQLGLGGINAPQFCSTTSSTTIKAQELSAQRMAATMLRSLSQGFEWVHTVETADLYLTKSGMVKLRDGDAVFYIDDNHLSLAGTHLAKERIRSAVTNLVQKPPPH